MTTDNDPDHEQTIEEWLAGIAPVLSVARRGGWNEFADRYERVLHEAGEQLGPMNDRFVRLIAQGEHMKPDDLLREYVDAMSVQVDGRNVFLPSFSDQCFWDIVKGSLTSLSPFRGLYFSWKLSEISYLFQRGKNDLAFSQLEEFIDVLAVDQNRQSGPSDVAIQPGVAAGGSQAPVVNSWVRTS